MGAGIEPCIDLQFVTAGQAGGRMHQHMVAGGIAFGVQPLQHAQRAVVPVVRDGALAVAV
jgi:hypothetical protein